VEQYKPSKKKKATQKIINAHSFGSKDWLELDNLQTVDVAQSPSGNSKLLSKSAF
jgi:hypothetical protein